jgi:hypothetical protein
VGCEHAPMPVHQIVSLLVRVHWDLGSVAPATRALSVGPGIVHCGPRPRPTPGGSGR